MLRVFTAPGATLDLEEITQFWFDHLIEINEELFLLILNQPAQAILFDRYLRLGFEVFAIETQGLGCWCQVPAAGKQHVLELTFALLPNQRQPGADVGNDAFDIIDEIVFAIAQASL